MNVERMIEGVNDMNEWFTVAQASKEVDIPTETVRRYIRQYGNYLMINRGSKRSYLVHETSLDTLKKIRYLLDQGNQREQVEEVLQRTETLTVHVDDEEMNDYLMTLPQLHRETAKHMQQLTEQVERQSDVINKFGERLEQQQEYIDKRLEERDEALMHVMNEVMESNKQIATSKEVEKKGFWSRLFNR